MPWVRLDDGWFEHPKFRGMSAAAMGKWVMMVSWSARNLTDGFVPRVEAGRICVAKGRAFVTQMRRYERSGLLHRDDEAGGWWIHDFDDYQMTSDTVRKRRDQEKEKKRRQRAAGADTAIRDDTGQFVSPGDNESVSPASPSRPPLNSSTPPYRGDYPQAVENPGDRGTSSTPGRSHTSTRSSPRPRPRPRAQPPAPAPAPAPASKIPDPRSTVPRNPNLETRTQRRITGTTCPDCGDTGMILDPDLGAYPCPGDHP